MQVKACPDDGGWSDGYADELAEDDLLHLYFLCCHDFTGVFCISIPVAAS